MHTTGNCSNLPKVLDPCHWDLTKVGLMVPPLCPFMDLLGDTKRIVMQSFNKTIEVNLCAAKWQLVKKLAWIGNRITVKFMKKKKCEFLHYKEFLGLLSIKSLRTNKSWNFKKLASFSSCSTYFSTYYDTSTVPWPWRVLLILFLFFNSG